MLTIIETLWRLTILIGCAFVQFVAAIFGGFAWIFGTACGELRKFSKQILSKLDKGKYEAEMRKIAA
jgi:hypothetical protein